MYPDNQKTLPKNGRKYDVIVVYDLRTDPKDVYDRLKKGGTAIYINLSPDQVTCLKTSIYKIKIKIKNGNALVIKKQDSTKRATT